MIQGNRSLFWHISGLVLFCALVVSMWHIPVLFSGYSFEIPHLHYARNFADTGTFAGEDTIGRHVMASQHPTINSAQDGRLSTVIFAFFSKWIGWDNLAGWALLSSVILALSLVALWAAVSTLFSRRIAWITIVITALMPIYWKSAVYLSNFQLALLFLFISFASFALLRRRHWYALIVSGFFFGLSIAAKDLFLIFAPWYALSYIWLFAPKWKHVLKGGLLFFGIALCVYFIPYIGDIQEYGYPRNQNLARVWPGAEELANETYLHLYPDPYTYFFNREAFDASIVERAENATTLERAQLQKTLRAYGVGNWNVWRVLKNGMWLFINSIPSFFHLGTIGGVFLWLFILPGVVSLWREDRKMLALLGGLILTTYIVIRFVLGYNREHFGDIGWVLALLSALGVVRVSDLCAHAGKRISSITVSIVIMLILALQLVQANRVEFARLYRQTMIVDTLSVSRAIAQVPEQSVVAMPLHPMRTGRISFLSGRTTVIFAEETMNALLETGAISSSLEKYGVTHIARYPEELSARLQRETGVEILTDENPGARAPEVTTFIRYLLHHIY
jgi:hypothetical protein